jgi:nucleotide-binding universal stress UspA family protein
MKRLLVATDLTARSDRAMQRAFMLATEYEAELDVLHVMPEHWSSSILDAMEQAARRALKEQIDAIHPDRDVRYSTAIVQGQAYAEILQRSAEIKATLVILGIHRHQSRELFRGTTAERVVRFGNAPVLVVRKPPSAPYSRLMVAVDLSVHSLKALKLAADISKQADIYCVHALHEPFPAFLGPGTIEDLVSHKQRECIGMLKREIDVLREQSPSVHQYHTLMRLGDVRSVIRNSIAEVDADLVVVGTHGRTGISHAVLGSVAEDFLADCPVDVLAVKAW